MSGVSDQIEKKPLPLSLIQKKTVSDQNHFKKIMIRQLALTPGNDVSRLEHPLKLNPQEKIRLVLNTHQTVYRIKNCCGELNGLLALNNLCFNIRNRDWDKDFNAEAGTTLTEI
jgi:hypothetical protein